MMLVNWDHAPNIRCVIDSSHPDFDFSAHETTRDAKHKYCGGKQGKIKLGHISEGLGELIEYGRDVMWYTVPDSREGWAKALEIWECAAFEKIHKDKTLILDFSKIRGKGTPIGGMQNRPASGPVPLMNAFNKAASLKGANLPEWKQALYLDHYFAECVLVGGARRAARMSTKSWRDPGVFEFITVKRPIEYIGKDVHETVSYRNECVKSGKSVPYTFLWSSNNSVTVDDEFWTHLDVKKNQDGYMEESAQHARKVFRLVTESSYGDGTGEPGMINVHKLVQNNIGLAEYDKGDYFGSSKYQINDETQLFMQRLARRAKKKKYNMITNPCVSGDTMVLTDEGYKQVRDLIDVPFNAVVDGKKYEERKEWVLKVADLENMGNVITGSLPGGIKQRLALGTAVIHEPKIVFLDEPTSGVDPISRRNFWDLINELSEGGTTVLVTTHYLDEAEFCNDIILINAGKLIAQGNSQELKSNYIKNPILEIESDRVVDSLEILEKEKWVGETSIFGNYIHVILNDSTINEQHIFQLLQNKNGIAVKRVEKITPTLEDVFIHLIEKDSKKNVQ